MASKKKQSEGIAFLFMYNDDGDDEMENSKQEDGDVEHNEYVDMCLKHHEVDSTAGDARFTAEEDLAPTIDDNRMTVVDSENAPLTNHLPSLFSINPSYSNNSLTNFYTTAETNLTRTTSPPLSPSPSYFPNTFYN